jgi:putative FmdB family regulatory protein
MGRKEGETMPIYKFYCDACEEEYEDFRALDEDEGTGECLVCGSTEINRGELAEVECGCGADADDYGCGCC